MVMYDSTDLPINCYQLLSDAYRIYHLRNFYTTDNLRIALEDNLIENSAKTLKTYTCNAASYGMSCMYE